MTTTAAQAALIDPLEIPVSSPTPGNALTQSQWATLLAIADTVIPSISTDSAQASSKFLITGAEYDAARSPLEERCLAKGKEVTVNDYLEECPSSLPAFQALLSRTVNVYLREDAKKGLRVLLSALKSVLLCMPVSLEY